MNRQDPSVPWHTLSPHEALARLDSHAEGLSESDAAERLATFGPNALPEAGAASLLGVILRQFASPFVYILMFAAVVSVLLREWSDAVFILLVVVLDAGIGATQEWRAETGAAALKRTLRILPTIVRAGRRREVDIAELVPGDVVLLQPGAAVPADLRLISARDLRVDESLLTGEARAVAKDAEAKVAEDAVVGDRETMAYAGTMVVGGRGAGVVCATGGRTQLGAIAALLAGRGGRPPLLLRMETFSNRIALATIALVAILGAAQLARGDPLGEIFVFTIALAVSAIPEGLPMAITVALAVASARMGRRGVIVRLLPAVEALGSCTLIASDKTGTLTVNRLTVKRVVLPDGAAYDVEGEGLELEGALRPLGGDVRDGEGGVRRLARAAALTNEADVREQEEGVVEAQGDTVDIAFLVLAAKFGLRRPALVAEMPEIASLPYESQRGYSASLRRADGATIVCVKGAPELVLPMCANADAGRIEGLIHDLASDGYRVLAVAEGRLPEAQDGLSETHLEGLELLGLAGLIDPLRSEAPPAVGVARSAGIDVRMVTGDHPETALAIARQLDPSWRPDTVLTGAELARLDGPARTEAVGRAAVFARVEPAQKTLIVQELQAQGHFVAVTGDGVNDAPALKAAHVGVAMGARGADVARATADLVITDDDFASIVAGIEEGRAVYDNIRKIVWYLISTAVAEVLLFLLAVTTGLPTPLTAVQILWFNLVTEGVQDVALAFERKEPDVMRRKPRPPGEPIFDRQMIEQCIVMGVYVGGLSFALFAWLHLGQGVDESAARNLTLLFLVSYSNLHVLNCRSETRSAFQVPLGANPFLILGILGAQATHVAAMHIPLMQGVLSVGPVSFGAWAGALALAGTVLLLGEAYKGLRARPLARAAVVAEGK